jgi:hypothetical protein
MRASEVRSQASNIPVNIRDRRLGGYPHVFGNGEELRFEHNRSPLIEYPVMPDGQGFWRPGPGCLPGPARIVVNLYDRSVPEVMYHDPTQPVEEGRKTEPFAMANYRRLRE